VAEGTEKNFHRAARPLADTRTYIVLPFRDPLDVGEENSEDEREAVDAENVERKRLVKYRRRRMHPVR